jgi:hypothetical protein
MKLFLILVLLATPNLSSQRYAQRGALKAADVQLWQRAVWKI